MPSRRTFLISLAAMGAVALTTPVLAVGTAPQKATAITKVFGDGQKFIAVALTYGTAISVGDLDPRAFSVAGRTVTEVYPSASIDPADRAESGTVVIVALSPEDAAASLKVEAPKDDNVGGGRPDWSVGDPMESAPSWATPEATVDFNGAMIETTEVENLILDRFEQRVWNDPETGDTLAYNLFIPANYDQARSYPLVNFMHDAGNSSSNPLATLHQGLGAISWASPEDQAETPAFVLAPQFAEIVTDDASRASSMLETTINLITALTKEFSIDPARLYTTGQSGGGMLSIAMNIKYPDFFAASFLVACQWEPDLVAPLATKRLFIIVAQEDGKAFPGQNEITETLEAEGATVARAVWDGGWSAEQFQFAFDDLIAEGALINYVSLAAGTVIPEGANTQGAAAHTATWPIAYDIAPVRRWLLNGDG